MKTNYAKLGSFVACALFIQGVCAPSASAATIVCSGTVTAISMHANNSLMIQLSSMNAPVFFCNPEENWSTVAGYSTGPSMCKALFAMFLTAKATGTPVNNVYFDMNSAPSSCSTFTSWSSANIRHFLY